MFLVAMMEYFHFGSFIHFWKCKQLRFPYWPLKGQLAALAAIQPWWDRLVFIPNQAFLWGSHRLERNSVRVAQGSGSPVTLDQFPQSFKARSSRSPQPGPPLGQGFRTPRDITVTGQKFQ